MLLFVWYGGTVASNVSGGAKIYSLNYAIKANIVYVFNNVTHYYYDDVNLLRAARNYVNKSFHKR